MMNDARNPQVSEALFEVWRSIRNDYRTGHMVATEVLTFAHNAGLLTSTQHELWSRRIKECPGHEDEGGRDWCAYGCDMAKLRAWTES